MFWAAFEATIGVHVALVVIALTVAVGTLALKALNNLLNKR